MSIIRKLAVLIVPSVLLIVAFAGCTVSRRHDSSRQTNSSSQALSPSDVNRIIDRTRRALRTDPRNAQLHFELAVALQAAGDKSGYLEHIKLAASLAPQNSFYRFNLAEAYRAQGLKTLALKNALYAADIGRHDAKDMTPLYYQLVAELMAETGRRATAEHWYENALAALSAYQGVAACRRIDEIPKQWRSTVEEVRHRLSGIRRELGKNRPTQQWVATNMPWFQFGQHENGMQMSCMRNKIDKLAHRLATRQVMGSGIHIDLGMLLLTSGQVENATIEFLAALQIDEKQSKAWQMLGTAYVKEGRLDEAVSAFNKSCKLGNRDSCTLYKKTQEALQRLKNPVSAASQTP